MQRISMLGFRDTLDFSMGLERDAPVVLTRNNTTRFIERLRGRSTILVISHPIGAEAVEVYSPDGQRLLAIGRGIDDSPILMHPAGACVEFQGLPSSACDYVAAICGSLDATLELRKCLESSEE